MTVTSIHTNDFSTADTRLAQEDLDKFNTLGWVNVDLGLDKAFVAEVLCDLKRMRKSALKHRYPARRVYFDHLLHENLAAIELPFNDEICPDSVREFFQLARVGSLVRTLMNWSATVNSLSRLFCMGNYRYRGRWHRDHVCRDLENGNPSRARSSVQAGIYLEDQKGFRLLKKSYDRGGLNCNFQNDQKFELNLDRLELPLQPDSDSYYVVGGTPGSVLFFDPFLYHQGSNQGSRLDFHMRFDETAQQENLYINDFQDFLVVEQLHRAFDLKRASSVGIPCIPRQRWYTRCINTVNYRFPIYNLALFLLNREDYNRCSNFGRPDLLANTMYQRK